jgi:hypothetical protein
MGLRKSAGISERREAGALCESSESKETPGLKVSLHSLLRANRRHRRGTDAEFCPNYEDFYAGVRLRIYSVSDETERIDCLVRGLHF